MEMISGGTAGQTRLQRTVARQNAPCKGHQRTDPAGVLFSPGAGYGMVAIRSRFPDISVQVPVQFCFVNGPEREHISVTEASGRGVARLVADAAHGSEVVVTRRGTPIAAVVSVERLAALDELRRHLR